MMRNLFVWVFYSEAHLRCIPINCCSKRSRLHHLGTCLASRAEFFYILKLAPMLLLAQGLSTSLEYLPQIKEYYYLGAAAYQLGNTSSRTITEVKQH